MKPKHMWTFIVILVITLTSGQFLTTRAANITVDTTDDVLDAAGACDSVTLASLPGPDGVTSLREAMCATNVNAGPDTIAFNIPSCGSVCTIQPAIALPVLTDDYTTIDGYSQPGAAPATGTSAATLLVQIDGSLIANNNGFNISSANNLIQGLVINRFPWNGVAIGGSGAVSNTIAGNHIGVDASGTLDLGNGYDGVFVGLGTLYNLIGGDEPAARNVISGNEWEGVALHGSDTSSNTVTGNYIGTAADGLSAVANTLAGIRIYGGADNNTIGGDTAGERNIISGNLTEGILIEGEQSNDNIVSGNYIGTDVTGLVALPNADDGIEIDAAYDNRIGGNEADERNVISGNGNDGIVVTNVDNPGNVISGNYIGVDISGTTTLPNGDDGITLFFSNGHLIGGSTPGERNIISGNLEDGIDFTACINGQNIITGNYIGVDVTGETAVANQVHGVNIVSSSDNRIGGSTSGERNVISGNGDNGVRIMDDDSHDTTVIGNYIGVNRTGQAALPNTKYGILMETGAHHNDIGGEAAGEGNIISGNGDSGVFIGGRIDSIESTNFNSVVGNSIGVAADGITPLGNGSDGVNIGVNAPNNFIGPYNVIAYNSGDGVEVGTPLSIGNTITNNSIFSNDELGIKLSNGGNNMTPAPNILAVPNGPGVISGTALPGSVVQVFTSRLPDGEGEIHLGTTVAGGAGDYTLAVTQLQYPYLTATATDSGDGTSEFSPVFVGAVPVLHEDAHKSVHRETVAPGGLLTYTLAMTNTGTATAFATLTDTLSVDLTWTGSASATAGTLNWEPGNNRLIWTGSVDEGANVVITFQVQVNDDLPTGTTISNFALVDSGSGYVFEIYAPDVTVIDHKLYLPIVRR